jgi:hypothetical protein
MTSISGTELPPTTLDPAGPCRGDKAWSIACAGEGMPRCKLEQGGVSRKPEACRPGATLAGYGRWYAGVDSKPT